MILDDKYYLALDPISMTASWHNIPQVYDNNKLRFQKTKVHRGKNNISKRGYDHEDINNFVHNKTGKLTGNESYGIDIFFHLTTYKVFIKLDQNYQIDFKNSGNFGDLLGFDKKALKFSSYGTKFPDISNSIDNLYIRCSLLSESIVSGQRSNNCQYSFSTNTKARSLSLELQPMNYLWNKMNTKVISEVTFYVTDDEDREVDLNDIDISLTVVIKAV